jgi:hypothetical protein
MAIFHFNVMTANGTIFDEEGSELWDLDAARMEAIKDVRALISDAALHGFDISTRSIQICDALGKVLLVLPFTQALARRG